jgi:hypothetical protein
VDDDEDEDEVIGEAIPSACKTFANLVSIPAIEWEKALNARSIQRKKSP